MGLAIHALLRSSPGRWGRGLEAASLKAVWPFLRVMLDGKDHDLIVEHGVGDNVGCPRSRSASATLSSAPDCWAPLASAAGRVRLSDSVVAGVPPAAPTVRPAPSRPETYRVASASSYRRVPPRQSFPAAASACPPTPDNRSYPTSPLNSPYFSISLGNMQASTTL
jgi:hypothetical protein